MSERASNPAAPSAPGGSEADPGEGGVPSQVDSGARPADARPATADGPGRAGQVPTAGRQYPGVHETGTAPTMTDGHGPDTGGAGTGDALVAEVSEFRRRWEFVQVSFVDDPRQAVSDAESLVTDVIEDMIAGFRRQRQELESTWNEGQEASTEHLRRALQRYRDFFERLVRL